MILDWLKNKINLYRNKELKDPFLRKILNKQEITLGQKFHEIVEVNRNRINEFLDEDQKKIINKKVINIIKTNQEFMDTDNPNTITNLILSKTGRNAFIEPDKGIMPLDTSNSRTDFNGLFFNDMRSKRLLKFVRCVEEVNYENYTYEYPLTEFKSTINDNLVSYKVDRNQSLLNLVDVQEFNLNSSNIYLQKNYEGISKTVAQKDQIDPIEKYGKFKEYNKKIDNQYYVEHIYEVREDYYADGTIISNTDIALQLFRKLNNDTHDELTPQRNYIYQITAFKVHKNDDPAKINKRLYDVAVQHGENFSGCNLFSVLNFGIKYYLEEQEKAKDYKFYISLVTNNYFDEHIEEIKENLNKTTNYRKPTVLEQQLHRYEFIPINKFMNFDEKKMLEYLIEEDKKYSLKDLTFSVKPNLLKRIQNNQAEQNDFEIEIYKEALKYKDILNRTIFKTCIECLNHRSNSYLFEYLTNLTSFVFSDVADQNKEELLEVSKINLNDKFMIGMLKNNEFVDKILNNCDIEQPYGDEILENLTKNNHAMLNKLLKQLDNLLSEYHFSNLGKYIFFSILELYFSLKQSNTPTQKFIKTYVSNKEKLVEDKELKKIQKNIQKVTNLEEILKLFFSNKEIFNNKSENLSTIMHNFGLIDIKQKKILDSFNNSQNKDNINILNSLISIITSETFCNIVSYIEIDTFLNNSENIKGLNTFFDINKNKTTLNNSKLFDSKNTANQISFFLKNAIGLNKLNFLQHSTAHALNAFEYLNQTLSFLSKLEIKDNSLFYDNYYTKNIPKQQSIKNKILFLQGIKNIMLSDNLHCEINLRTNYKNSLFYNCFFKADLFNFLGDSICLEKENKNNIKQELFDYLTLRTTSGLYTIKQGKTANFEGKNYILCFPNMFYRNHKKNITRTVPIKIMNVNLTELSKLNPDNIAQIYVEWQDFKKDGSTENYAQEALKTFFKKSNSHFMPTPLIYNPFRPTFLSLNPNGSIFAYKRTANTTPISYFDWPKLAQDAIETRKKLKEINKYETEIENIEKEKLTDFKTKSILISKQESNKLFVECSKEKEERMEIIRLYELQNDYIKNIINSVGFNQDNSVLLKLFNRDEYNFAKHYCEFGKEKTDIIKIKLQQIWPKNNISLNRFNSILDFPKDGIDSAFMLLQTKTVLELNHIGAKSYYNVPKNLILDTLPKFILQGFFTCSLNVFDIITDFSDYRLGLKNLDIKQQDNLRKVFYGGDFFCLDRSYSIYGINQNLNKNIQRNNLNFQYLDLNFPQLKIYKNKSFFDVNFYAGYNPIENKSNLFAIHLLVTFKEVIFPIPLKLIQRVERSSIIHGSFFGNDEYITKKQILHKMEQNKKIVTNSFINIDRIIQAKHLCLVKDIKAYNNQTSTFYKLFDQNNLMYLKNPFRTPCLKEYQTLMHDITGYTTHSTTVVKETTNSTNFQQLSLNIFNTLEILSRETQKGIIGFRIDQTIQAMVNQYKLESIFQEELKNKITNRVICFIEENKSIFSNLTYLIDPINRQEKLLVERITKSSADVFQNNFIFDTMPKANVYLSKMTILDANDYVENCILQGVTELHGNKKINSFDINKYLPKEIVDLYKELTSTMVHKQDYKNMIEYSQKLFRGEGTESQLYAHMDKHLKQIKELEKEMCISFGIQPNTNEFREKVDRPNHFTKRLLNMVLNNNFKQTQDTLDYLNACDIPNENGVQELLINFDCLSSVNSAWKSNIEYNLENFKQKKVDYIDKKEGDIFKLEVFEIMLGKRDIFGNELTNKPNNKNNKYCYVKPQKIICRPLYFNIPISHPDYNLTNSIFSPIFLCNTPTSSTYIDISHIAGIIEERLIPQK